MAEAKTTKKVVAKKAPAAEKVKVAPKKEAKVSEKVQAGLSIDIVDTKGTAAGTMALPESVFGAKLNKALIAQAVRVYLVNQRRGTVDTKTRGEVEGSTRKIYRQKGTGRARHGGIRAPIFVKGGIAHGPKQRDYDLSMSKKMKVAAFASAMSARFAEKAMVVVAGIEALEPKTKVFAGMVEAVAPAKKQNVLLVMPKHMEKVFKAARNIEGVEIASVEQLNTYQVLSHKKLVFMKEAIDTLSKEHTK